MQKHVQPTKQKYPCTDCGTYKHGKHAGKHKQVFATRQGLAGHYMARHSGFHTRQDELPLEFACSHCDKAFATLDGRWVHTQKRHPGNEGPRPLAIATVETAKPKAQRSKRSLARQAAREACEAAVKAYNAMERYCVSSGITRKTIRNTLSKHGVEKGALMLAAMCEEMKGNGSQT